MTRRDSLRVRLPLFISGLILLVLMMFLWVAYREVEQALVRNGGVRAQTAADHLASLLAQSAQQRLADVGRAAASASVRRVFHERTEAELAAAQQRLTTLTAAGQPPVEVWDAAGQRVLEVSGPAAAADTTALPPSTAPSSIGLSPFYAAGGTVWWEAVAAVQEPGSQGVATAAQSTPIGYIRLRRSFATTSTSEVITRLVGDGAVVKLGNQTGDVWSDLAKVVSAPPVAITQPGVQIYRATAGEIRLGAAAPIRGTPWAVWVEFPYAGVVAPAWTFVNRMLVIGFSFVLIAAVGAAVVSARITTPLRDLTNAAEAIAAGKYSQRVATGRRDELGRLGQAFNTMAEQVEDSHRDLEQRVQQRVEEVKEAREELDRFFSLSVDLLCIAGEDGYFKRVNPAWEEVLGWTVEELTSRPYRDLIHPDDRGVTENEHARAVKGVSTSTFENRYRRKDGTYRWLQWKSAALPERGIVYAAARDVTDEKTAARAMEEHAEALASANKELEAFSYSVSHDLRAPLRHVTGFANLLDQRAGQALDEQGRRYLKTMMDSATRMGHLIDDLLAFSRMGRAAMTKRRIRLAPLVEEVRAEVMADAVARNIIWTIRPLPDVDADRDMLRMVFVNLLSNAVKYTGTRAEARIEVGAIDPQSREVVVFVRDNGVGFDMQYADKLFGVFQRLHRADEFEGTGIGLANVRRIVHRHGGRVWADSEIDRGSTFYVALPAPGEHGND